ncbi:MAG: type II secretion system protein, partial [Candidatus Riflebacteria bacterium]|nr:type II secretion system protein [Candidatus Riflebacteria bacterium]
MDRSCDSSRPGSIGPGKSAGPRRRGFTLVEILVALAVLSIVIVGVYEILVGMFRSGTVTQWEQNLTTQFSNADTRLRSYLNGASYPVMLTPQGSVMLNKESAAGEAFFLAFPGSSGTAEFEGGAVTENQVFLSWFRCEAGQVGLEGLPDKEPKGAKIELAAKSKGRTK